MTADDSIRTDASTVHPPGDQQASDIESSTPNGTASNEQDVDQMAKADTVIRGSSRAPSKRPPRDNRTPAAVAKVLLGQRLNHFELQELIGGGGMGAVFRAHDEQLDREVAIKVIPFAGDDADLQRRFRNEAQSAAKLDHPRIARVFDVGHQDDWYYIVFEYVRGVNVRDLVSRAGELSIDDAVFYACQVADALQHASNRGIVHRDVKPSNVLIDKNRQVKLVDMGLARSEKMEVSQQDLTASGVTLGTFDYISPEQAKDPRAADLRSDIYSLGCTLYFMLTSQPPYPGGTMLQKLLSHGNSPPPDARLLRSNVSYELSAIIQKMLAKHPEQRYQNTIDLIADLRELAFREGLSRSQGVSPVATGRPNPIARWMERHSPWLAAGALLLISAGWLEFNSFSIKDEFTIPVAKPIASPPFDSNAGTPDEPSGTGTQSQTPPGQADSNTSVPDTPPTFMNPASQEQTDPVAPITVPTITPDTGVASATEDGITDMPGTQAVAEQSMLSEFPRLVRVVGPEVLVEQSIDQVQRDTDGAALTTSLSQALELSERYYDISRIEIATQLVYSEPVVVRRDDLSIASTVGGSTIVFQSPDKVSLQRPHMISLGNCRIELEDLHLVWDVPRSEPNGGSLIATNENRLIRIKDSTITIRNQAEIGRVYALEVITDPANRSTASIGDVPLVDLRMNNVIVRGQMTMIHMDYAAALQLQWENGLLAISQRMIQTNGTFSEPLSPTPMQLRLTRLTAEIPKGMIQMRLDKEGAFPITIDREAQECVFVVDQDASHIDVIGTSTLESNPAILKFHGEANVYDIDTTKQRSFTQRSILSLTDINDQTVTTQLDDLSSSEGAWPDEKSVGWNAAWASDRSTEITPDRFVIADFRQYGDDIRGFDEEQLPNLGRDLFELDTPGVEAVVPEVR